ncbi:MAG: DUF1579 family protein [Gemmatimonadales bacterium]
MRLGLLLLLVAGCGWEGDVAARAGEQTLTVEELAQMFARQPGPAVSPKLVARVATWWVEYQLFAQRLAAGDSMLDSATVLEVMWPQARGYILGRWRAQLFASQLPLDSAAVDSVYRADRYRLIQHILIRARPGGPAAHARRRRQADTLRSRLARGLSWEAAQAENQDAVARARGGSIGVIQRGQTDPEIERAAFALAPGGISPVLESRLGLHIVRRPRLHEVRREFHAAVEPLVAAYLDTLHIRNLARQRRLALTPAALERARAAVGDPLRYLESRSVIATFDGGRFTLADLVRWLRTISDVMHTQLERGDDQQLPAFLRDMMGYELLYREAVDHGVTLTPAEFAELKATLARRLERVQTALHVYPPGAGDSGSAEERQHQAARRVDAYVMRLTGDWQGFASVPMLLAERLKRTSPWKTYPRQFERAVERAAELRAQQEAAGDIFQTPNPGLRARARPSWRPLRAHSEPSRGSQPRNNLEDVMKRAYRTVTAALVLAGAPALAAQAPPAPQPGPEHQQLAYFAGRWNSTGEFQPGPMGPGGRMTVRNNCERFPGGFFIVCRSEGTTPMGPSHGLGILGYDPERKHYTYYAIDNSGMPPEPIRGTLSGDTWVWEGEGTMGGQQIKGRYTMKVVSPDEYTWTWELQMPGQPWTTIARGTDTRVK